jgi:hypothetical protein
VITRTGKWINLEEVSLGISPIWITWSMSGRTPKTPQRQKTKSEVLKLSILFLEAILVFLFPF